MKDTFDYPRLLALSETMPRSDLARMFGLKPNRLYDRLVRARQVCSPDYVPRGTLWANADGTPTELLQRLREMVVAGKMSTAAMADELGVTKNAVIGACNRNDLRIDPRRAVSKQSTKWKTADGEDTPLLARLRTILEGKEAGVPATLAAASEAMGINDRYLSDVRRRYGIGQIGNRHVGAKLKEVRQPDQPLRPYVPTAAARKRKELGIVIGRRYGRAQAPISREEQARLVEEAIAAGRVTKCPPVHAWGTGAITRELAS